MRIGHLLITDATPGVGSHNGLMSDGAERLRCCVAGRRDRGVLSSLPGLVRPSTPLSLMIRLGPLAACAKKRQAAVAWNHVGVSHCTWRSLTQAPVMGGEYILLWRIIDLAVAAPLCHQRLAR